MHTDTLSHRLLVLIILCDGIWMFLFSSSVMNIFLQNTADYFCNQAFIKLIIRRGREINTCPIQLQQTTIGSHFWSPNLTSSSQEAPGSGQLAGTVLSGLWPTPCYCYPDNACPFWPEAFVKNCNLNEILLKHIPVLMGRWKRGYLRN